MRCVHRVAEAERGSVSVTPPALSGKGVGGLGRMRKVSQ